MQRSGSQKALLVISIITIVFAVIGLILSAMTIAGGALVGAIDSNEAAEVLEGTGVTQGQVAAGIGFVGIVLLIGCVIELIEGILGVRAANDNQKIMPVWVLAIIGLVISFIGAMFLAVQGRLTDSPSTIITLVMSALMLWIATNIKKQAGR